jgi:hypothetical protein
MHHNVDSRKDHYTHGLHCIITYIASTENSFDGRDTSMNMAKLKHVCSINCKDCYANTQVLNKILYNFNRLFSNLGYFH